MIRSRDILAQSCVHYTYRLFFVNKQYLRNLSEKKSFYEKKMYFFKKEFNYWIFYSSAQLKIVVQRILFDSRFSSTNDYRQYSFKINIKYNFSLIRYNLLRKFTMKSRFECDISVQHDLFPSRRNRLTRFKSIPHTIKNTIRWPLP